MKYIIDLLTEKNNCLEKFFRLNEAEILNIQAGQYDNVQDFYSVREDILTLIRVIDSEIEKSNELQLDKAEIEPQMKKVILEALDYKNQLVNKILEQDLTLLSLIEQAKSEIIKELAQVRSAKKAIGAYKSGAAEQKLDEEA